MPHTHTQTTEYSATQLVQSLKFKLSHAIIVIEIFDLSPTPTWRSVLLSCGQQLLWLKKRAEKRGRSLLNQIGDWTKSRITGERKSWGGNTCHRVAFWSSWSWSYLPFGGILIILVLVMILIISATMWHSEYWSTRSGSYLPPGGVWILIILVTIKSATRWQTNHLDLGKPWSKYIFFLILDILEMIFQFDTFITILVIWEKGILWLWWLKLQTWMAIVLNAE